MKKKIIILFTLTITVIDFILMILEILNFKFSTSLCRYTSYILSGGTVAKFSLLLLCLSICNLILTCILKLSFVGGKKIINLVCGIEILYIFVVIIISVHLGWWGANHM